MPDIEILNTVVCDDVRKEASGKFLLIGVYGDAIVVPSLPRNVFLSLWCHVVPKKLGLMTIDVILEGPDNQKASGTINASIAVTEQPFGIHIGALNLNVTRSGEVKFSIRTQGENRWRCVHKKFVSARDDPSTTLALSAP